MPWQITRKPMCIHWNKVRKLHPELQKCGTGFWTGCGTIPLLRGSQQRDTLFEVYAGEAKGDWNRGFQNGDFAKYMKENSDVEFDFSGRLSEGVY